MVDPTIIATFSLLLRPVGVFEGVGEPAGWVGVGVMALEVSGAEDEAGVVMGVDAAEGRGWSVVMVTEDVVVRDVLIADIVGPVVGFDAALEAAVPPPSCGSVRNTGCCPACNPMLKSLLMNVGGVALEVPRSDTSKWHTQAFPSSRGTRVEPVGETDWLYAGRLR